MITVIPEWSSGFPYFLQFKSEFGNKEFMIWATVSSQSCFCSLYRASPSLAAKNLIILISVFTIWWCPCVVSSLVLLEEGVCYLPWNELVAAVAMSRNLEKDVKLTCLCQIHISFSQNSYQDCTSSVWLYSFYTLMKTG